MGRGLMSAFPARSNCLAINNLTSSAIGTLTDTYISSTGLGPAGEMAQWERYLLCNNEDLSSDAQHPCTNQALWHGPVTSALWMEGDRWIPGERWLASVVQTTSSGFSERLP